MGLCGSKDDVTNSNTAPTDAPVPAASKVTETKSGKSEATSPPTPATSSAPVKPEDVEVNFKPIHSALRWGKPLDVVEPMIQSEAAANCRDTNNGNCPLHIAAQNGHLELCKMLVNKNADTNCQNKKLNTPLHMALSYDYLEVANFLMANGADKELKNEAGFAAKVGIDGDKAVPIVKIGLAKSGNEVMKALQECDACISDIDKASLVKTCLNAKKDLGDEWTAEIGEKFKEVNFKL